MTVLALSASPSLAVADSFATAGEAKAQVRAALKAIAANPGQTLKEITAKDPKWTFRDLYLQVYQMDGKCLAHGQNVKQVGRNLLSFTDIDGKPIIRERLQLAANQEGFWQTYKFTDPLTKKVLPKSTYCEKSGELLVCSGIYHR